MEFGKRSRGAQAMAQPSMWLGLGPDAAGKRGTSRKHLIATSLAGVLLGFGGVTAGTTFVHASERAGLLGLFDSLFNPPAPRRQVVVAPRPSPKRYSSLPDVRRIGAARPRAYTPRPVAAVPDLRSRARGPIRPVSAANRPGGAQGGAQGGTLGGIFGGQQTVCVRTCDGYLFPLGRLAAQGDMPVHQAACAAACPNAGTALFTLPAGRSELDQAVSLKGQPYLAMAWANVYRQKRVQNCSCQPPGVAAMPLAIGSDPTVRIGDVVATEAGANVVTDLVRGQVRVADYRYARTLSRNGRVAIDRQVGAIRREAAEAAFRRSLQAAEAKTARIRIAEAGAARLRAMEAEPGFTAVETVSDGPRGFTPVRTVSPSLYGP